MANERGLPSVPRGLPRDLTVYLQSLAETLLRLSGSVRGSGDARAVRAAERSSLGFGASTPGQAAILSWMLKDKAVTSDKLADGAVTETKLGMSAVTEQAIRPGAVTEAALAAEAVTGTRIADGAVDASKLACGVLPVVIGGAAVDGETVVLPGTWRERPWVALALVTGMSSAGVAGALDLREAPGDAETGVWRFDAAGNFHWIAVGWRRA